MKNRYCSVVSSTVEVAGNKIRASIELQTRKDTFATVVFSGCFYIDRVCRVGDPEYYLTETGLGLNARTFVVSVSQDMCESDPIIVSNSVLGKQAFSIEDRPHLGWHAFSLGCDNWSAFARGKQLRALCGQVFVDYIKENEAAMLAAALKDRKESIAIEYKKCAEELKQKQRRLQSLGIKV